MFLHMLSLHILMLISNVIGSTPISEHTKDIHKKLFDDYYRTVLPSPIFGARFSVHVSFSLFSLDEVNEKDQSVVTTGRLFLRWSDRAFVWNKGRYGNVSSIFVDQKDIWLPDITVGNSITSNLRLGFDELPCRVKSDGSVHWTPTVRLQTSCTIDVTYFPFDTQECDIVFETLITSEDEVTILLDLVKIHALR
ncbi:neuronal acetylcholine receptor subunit alpha-7 [Plakobranchus ocellatus]|uniref:Neuronal acetylcholine receptor subunit alpha-7 n=1 Tax=Plakobranchus ocellatus TaxID=259542 RepID=A0AAV3ZA05_9GAST|nr:neuronal acetylcholine receptor subunit alpha-7 [Plakobranchus ocellatus]